MYVYIYILHIYICVCVWSVGRCLSVCLSVFLCEARHGERERERALALAESFQLHVCTHCSSDAWNVKTLPISAAKLNEANLPSLLQQTLQPQTEDSSPRPMLGKLGAAGRNGDLVASGPLIFKANEGLLLPVVDLE